jgi:hypothetical protein
MYKTKAGQPFPSDLTKNGRFSIKVLFMHNFVLFYISAIIELDNFAKILEAEGVTVRRPEVTPVMIEINDLHHFVITLTFRGTSARRTAPRTSRARAACTERCPETC